MKNPFKKHETFKAVFSVTIDTNYQYRNKFNNSNDEGLQLQQGGRYYFQNRKNEEGTSYENISDFATGVITSDLPDICRQYLDFPVTIQVTGKHDGSLVIVFAAIFSAMGVISSAKGVYDVALLIRDLAKERIEKRLLKEYGDYFDVRVEKRLPRDLSRDCCCEKQMSNRKYSDSPFQSQSGGRDAFFWYLLVSNILLFGFLASLVIKALSEVYW